MAAGAAAVPDLSGLAVNAADPTAGLDIGALSDAGGASPFDAWMHGLEQTWITSPLGQQVDTLLNDWFNQADPAADTTGGACGLVCNGADGTPDGTLAQADGQGGGVWFGNGGNGVTDADGVGGRGGDAGGWGNGGNGGNGIDGHAGGDGGDGGLYGGNGGNGGAGGDSHVVGGVG